MSKFLLSSIIYIAAVLGANYTATWFLPIPIFGQFAIGTLIFGATFTQRDRLHQYGKTSVYWVILITAIVNLIMSALLSIPIRILIASFTAILIAESIDTEIFDRLKTRSWLSRVATSNAVSVPLDTLLFGAIAFWGVLPASTLVSIFFGETLIKYAIGLIVAFAKTERLENARNNA